MYFYVNFCDIYSNSDKASYYEIPIDENSNLSFLPAEAMEDRNPYPFGIDPVK